MLKTYKDVAGYVIVPVAVLLSSVWFFWGEPKDLEKIIRTYSGTIISLGTLFLVSVLAIFAAHLASHSAEITAQNNRRVQAELRMAEFRQAWISEMRDDISELIGLSFNSKSEDDVSRAYSLSMKIEMRLNPTEELAIRVSKGLQELSNKVGNNHSHNTAMAELAISSRAYLKSEWARLKQDVEDAQLLARAWK